MERIVSDHPARSEILFFKQSGEYFCHLCLVQGESIEIETTSQTRYPIKIHPITEEIQLAPLRSIDYWKKYIHEGRFNQGLKSLSPILNQDWNPTPSIVCCYDSMHVLYEGVFQEMMKMISVKYWERFDTLFLKHKYPSFLHKHPRKTTNGQIMNSLKAIEVYMICHYYLELFSHIKGSHKISKKVNIIHRFAVLIDRLTDSFKVSELDSINEDLSHLLDLQDPLTAAECIVGHYIVRKELDFLVNLNSNEVFQVSSFSEDFRQVTLISITTKRTKNISKLEGFDLLPCVVLELPNEKKYLSLHYNSYQYF